MPENTPAVLFEVDAIAGARKSRLRISISSPYDTGKGDWACLFQLRGVEGEEEEHEYFGVDGLQAMILNLFYLRSVIVRLRKNGFAFREIASGELIDPERYFDSFSKPA
jgi:hypothetical protein